MTKSHDFPYRTIKTVELGAVQRCRACGVMRKKVKGIYHYYAPSEHLGSGLHTCPAPFRSHGQLLDNYSHINLDTKHGC